MGKRTVGDIYLRRYKTCDIPRDEEGATNFLMDVYKEKDELLGHYKETDGQEFTDQKVEVIKVYNGIFRIYSLHTHYCDPYIVAILSHFFYLGSKENWSFDKYNHLESDNLHSYTMQAWFNDTIWKLNSNGYSHNYNFDLIPRYEKVH